MVTSVQDDENMQLSLFGYTRQNYNAAEGNGS